jgi:thiamine-phosphate pyrophosphorylase
LALLAEEAAARVRGTKTKLLINSRVDVAIAAGADGVHLRSDDIAASEARAIWGKSTGRVDCVVGVSCHSINDVLSAEGHGADFVVFGPIFGKVGSVEPPFGLESLRTAGQSLGIPVIALGGVTLENARACLEVGANGIAGIRIFQDNDVEEVVRRSR